MGLKKDFLAPVLVLSLICLVVSGALAVTNGFTEPVIADAAGQREDEVRGEIMPGADDFERLEVEGLPESVKEVYKASNGDGYVFTVVSGGYGGGF